MATHRTDFNRDWVRKKTAVHFPDATVENADKHARHRAYSAQDANRNANRSYSIHRTSRNTARRHRTDSAQQRTAANPHREHTRC